ncbi:hypothetical protein [Pseudomonas gingeri]|uniref:hypothetical protein n=1 Tax=Pseudomonas gingeri TaxID=117681 RepID=UPI0015A0835F|nr:hypothetical protein [Pseudomonas gingeri]NWA03747.1 hypothetical protein [Pseudomonas gingeri]NWA14606.1 hypothetical protein [Pseudomonas gingeri]NWA58734.1 hypothetical protein [Pseudomonas gingeri]NWA94500.1 hypothetical protein [Pseudomonas gingeri]NWB01156.1 hypothetical protein [Pseudomonas gingeri]
MEHEVIVEGFCLRVEVTHCENVPPSPGTWNSDWDFYGSREIDFVVISGVSYDDDGIKMDVSPYECYQIAEQYSAQIEVALWIEIDAAARRQRWAA